jgi:uncharacterized membrane protein YoaK (UPF0700 family)
VRYAAGLDGAVDAAPDRPKAAARVRAEETLRVAGLPSIPGGFLDAFTVCLTFAAGATLGAVLTTQLASAALIVPIALLLASLMLCRGA